MMKLRDIISNIRKTIPAAVGGLFLSALLYGCGYTGTGETIVIGAKEQNMESASGEGGLEVLEGLKRDSEQRKAEKQEPTEEPETLIRVYVCGAVICPGVVELPEGSRVEDALQEAGGFAQDAAPQALNLADWVEDGRMLYFPTRAEAEEMKAENNGMFGQNQAAGSNLSAGSGKSVDSGKSSGLVNINTADAAALTALPGIGESRAGDIISYREKNGAFASCEDIMKVSGIKTSVYEKICDKITVK